MEDKHVLVSFDLGEATEMVERKLFQLEPITMLDNYEADTLLLTQDVVELNERKAFLENVASYLGMANNASADELLQEVKKRYAEKGIELKKAVKLWFQKEDVSPSTDQAYRRNLYDFCIAMGMNYHETAEFFLKAFLTIPYNYKDRDDAVYFFCIKEGRPYSVIKQLLETADSFETMNTDVASTEEIGLQILDIQSDEEFLEYLQRHCYDRKHQYTTAKKRVVELASLNKTIVPGRDKEGMELPFDALGTSKNSTLLNAILGYTYQGLDATQRKHMKASGLPVFPRDGDLGDILETNSEASFEILRKTLILMKFYNFYRGYQLSSGSLTMEDDDINANLYDFYDSTNDELARCGFVQIYLRNPFDWIILFCANSPNPIDYLKDFIQKRYLGNLE